MKNDVTPARANGSTLIEMLTAIVLLGIISSVTALAARRAADVPVDDPLRVLADSIRHAVSSGRATHVRVVVSGRPVNFNIGADGSVVADSALHVDRLSGAPVNAR